MNRFHHATYLLIAALAAQSVALNAAFDGNLHQPKKLLNYGPRSPKARRMAMDRRLGLIEAKFRNIQNTPIPAAELEQIGKILDALQRAYSLPAFDTRTLMGPLERARYERQEAQQRTQKLAQKRLKHRKAQLEKIKELKKEFEKERRRYQKSMQQMQERFAKERSALSAREKQSKKTRSKAAVLKKAPSKLVLARKAKRVKKATVKTVKADNRQIKKRRRS